MRSEERRRLRVDWLTDLGVPTPFHDAITDAPKVSIASRYLLGILLFAMIFGVEVGVIFWLGGHARERALALVTETGASLFHVSLGFGFFVLWIGLMALMIAVSAGLAARCRAARFLSSSAAMVNRRPRLWPERRIARWILGGSVRRAAREASTVDDFLRALANDQARRWARRGAVLALLAAPLMALDANSFWVAGPSGVFERSMFSGRYYDLSRAAAVTTGCHLTDQGYRLVYEVRFEFPGARSYDLGAARPVRGDKIAAIEEIDRRLSATVIQWRRSYLGDECLAHWARKAGNDGRDRLARLLHLRPEEMSGRALQ